MSSPVFSMEAAYRIWMAHREIEVGKKLLADIAETIKGGGDPTPADDHNRHRRGYTLGVPHGTGERVLGVSPQLAATVIEAHIADKRRELAEATQAAMRELEGASR